MILILPLICKVVDKRCTTLYQHLLHPLLSYWLIYTGRPSQLSSDPDFVPTVFEFSRRTEASDCQKLARHERLLKRRTTTNVGVDDGSTSASSLKESVGEQVPGMCDIEVNTDTYYSTSLC